MNPEPFRYFLIEWYGQAGFQQAEWMIQGDHQTAATSFAAARQVGPATLKVREISYLGEPLSVQVRPAYQVAT